MYKDRRMDTENEVYIPMQYFSDMKKDEIMPFPVTGKKLEVITLSEITEKGIIQIKQIIESITSVESKSGYK